MSRTRRGGKPPGYEFWSRRPCSGNGHGKVVKDMTKAKERMEEKELIQSERKDLEKEEPDGSL